MRDICHLRDKVLEQDIQELQRESDNVHSVWTSGGFRPAFGRLDQIKAFIPSTSRLAKSSLRDPGLLYFVFPKEMSDSSGE